MKKKIKDLTIKEFNNFCEKQHPKCIGCPLNNIEYDDGKAGCDMYTYIYRIDRLNKQYNKYPLDQEIEVDADEEED